MREKQKMIRENKEEYKKCQEQKYILKPAFTF
jgi:hypothetical protein